MEPAAWLLFLAGAFVAEVIGTMAGFGAATVLTPIAACFMDIKTAIAVVACFHLFGNASRLVFFGRHIHWRTWAQFGITGVLASLAGAAVTGQLSSSMVKLAFGLFLFIYVALSSGASSRWRLPNKPLTLVGGGILSGFVAGLIGTGGAIRSACLLVFGLPKEAYIGTSAAIALVVDATRLPIYVAERFIPWRMASVLVSLMGVAFAGAWVGQRLIRRISSTAFRRFVLIMLALMGVKLVADAWRDRNTPARSAAASIEQVEHRRARG